MRAHRSLAFNRSTVFSNGFFWKDRKRELEIILGRNGMTARHSTHVPPGFSAVTPYLTVDDPDMLVSFVAAGFGAEELTDQRALGSDGKTTHTAFRVEGCIIETGRASNQSKTFPASLHIYVPDADATYAQAIKAGGASLHDVRDMKYGERSGAVQDPCGNHWYIATFKGLPTET